MCARVSVSTAKWKLDYCKLHLRSGTIDSMGDTVFQPEGTVSASHLTGLAVCKPDVRFVNVIRNVELVCKNLRIHFAGI